MTRWLARIAVRAAPLDWRDAITRDLDDEARALGRGGLWVVWQAIRVGLRLRWTLGRDAMFADARYAIRSLFAARWFTAGAVLTFALGIGINVAVFSAVDRVLFRPLPYAHPEELVFLHACSRTTGDCYGTLPAEVPYQLVRQSATMQDFSAVSFNVTALLSPDSPLDGSLSFVNVSPGALRTLGVQPVLGRDVTNDEIANHANAAWINDETWQTRFSRDPQVAGRRVWIAGAGGTIPVTILGVLPRGFMPPSSAYQWNGLMTRGDGTADIDPTGRAPLVFARLKPGVTVAAAQAEVAAVERSTGRSARADSSAEYVRVDPLQAGVFSTSREYLWLVILAAALVLLMACANLASLFLARGRSRQQVAAVCTALGASSARVIGAAILESLFVCLTGAAVAFAALAAAERALVAALPPLFSQYAAGLADGRVIAFALAATGLCAIVAGALPAWRLTRVEVLPVLQQSSKSGQSVRRRGGRSLLVIESALGSMLVLGAGLAVTTFAALTREDLGFRPDGLYLVSGTNPAIRAFHDRTRWQEATRALSVQIADALRRLPGIGAVGQGDYLPGAGEAPCCPFAKGVRGFRVHASSGYFDVLGMRLLAGRAFTDDDVAAHALVAIMDTRGAQLVWPSVQPAQVVGRLWQPTGEPARVVVGVVEPAKFRYGAGGLPPVPAVFLPFGAEPSHVAAVAFRTTGAPPAARSIRAALENRVPGLRVMSMLSVSESLDSALTDPRFRAVLLSAFALTGLFLAAAGLFAVASYDAALRRYEMGVRIVLGAAPRDIRRLLLREACVPVAVGALIGLASAWWTSRFAQAFLYKTDRHDPIAYAAVALVLLAAAGLAAWRPARDASRTDPAIVLRAQ